MSDINNPLSPDAVKQANYAQSRQQDGVTSPGSLASDLIGTAEALATDAVEIVSPTSALHDRIDGVESMTQEIINFLHRLFPGHAAPGAPAPTA
jgi:hypothetical protein